MAWFFVILAATLNTGANVLLKSIGEDPLGPPAAAYFSPLFIAACGLFGLNLLAYTQALKTMPLSVAYPMLVGISAFGIAAASMLSFGDTFTPQRVVGYVLLVVAIYLIGT